MNILQKIDLFMLSESKKDNSNKDKINEASRTDIDELTALLQAAKKFSTVSEKSTKQKKWLGKVKVKWHAPKGLFDEGSAEEIADTVSKGVDLKTAMSRLNYFLNRGGENVPSDIKKKVEKAKELVRKKFNK